MIVSPNPQGSESWFKDRAGIPSASNFDSIITSRGKPTTGSKPDTYMRQLLAEWFVDKPVDTIEPTRWMQRGIELEPEARELYEFITNNEVEQVGFCFKDKKKLVGCSPDGLVKEGLVEVKCPKASTMMSYFLDGKLPSIYIPQVQGQLWITEKQWCDFFAYHPELPPFQIRVERDEHFIKLLAELIDDFIETMLEKKKKLQRFK